VGDRCRTTVFIMRTKLCLHVVEHLISNCGNGRRAQSPAANEGSRAWWC
jgi:hypothetical protein